MVVLFFVKFEVIQSLLIDWINRHKAGSPTDPTVYWIHFRPVEIARLFKEETGHVLSHRSIKKQLREMDFKYRKMSKDLPTGQYEQRNLQFQIIWQIILATTYQTPIISIDCKKKELIGNLYRAGKCYTKGQTKVYDHDYSYLADGKVIPHGIYDIQRNEGYITIGNSHETADFICENILWWWDSFGIHQYPDSNTIVILCDAGGGNSYRHYAFKKELLDLCEMIGKKIIVCHYPPYASKWNVIEHRLFAHLHRAMQGVVFVDYQTVKTLIENTSTKTGLKVVARIVDKKYQIGIKTCKDEVNWKRIKMNTEIPKLSYTIAA